MPKIAGLITSTADLDPDGWKGYLKGVLGFVTAVGGVLAGIQPLLPEGTIWARYVGIGIAVCGAIAIVLTPNAVKPVVVAPAGGAGEVPGPGV